MFFKPLSKCSSSLSYVLLITFQPITFESIYYTIHSFFVMWSLSFVATSLSFVVFPLLK